MKTQFSFILVLVVMLLPGFKAVSSPKSIEKSTDWYLAREVKGVSLFYRWVKLNCGRETREMKAEFVIKAEIPTILEQFSSSEKYKQWAAGIKTCKVEKRNDSIWIAHSVMNYPFPFRKKDLLTKHQVQINAGYVEMQIEAIPEYKPKNKGVERIKNYTGTWTFVPKEVGTFVVCRVITGEKPLFPRFMQDPVVQKISIDSFSELKYLAEGL